MSINVMTIADKITPKGSNIYNPGRKSREAQKTSNRVWRNVCALTNIVTNFDIPITIGTVFSSV